MAEAVVMPKLGNTVESAIILGWHVAVGDRVSAGDLLCEIETDKATLEIESTASGVLLAQLCAVGEEVPVLSNIAVVGSEGESIADFGSWVRASDHFRQPSWGAQQRDYSQSETVGQERGVRGCGSW